MTIAMTEELGLALVKPYPHPPRLDKITMLLEDTSEADVIDAIFDITQERDEPLIIDLETRGNCAESSEFALMGIGFADSRGSAYIHLDREPSTKSRIMDILAKSNRKLIAHNVNFDATALLKETGVWLNWYVCTYAAYRHLASEGIIGQQWGLKPAQVALLGWEDKGDLELNEWLISHGYKNKAGSPLKGEMWRAPSSVLGKYCALDCDSTYLLYKYIFLPLFNKFKAYHDFHTNHFMALERELAYQQLNGTLIDVPKLSQYSAYLEQWAQETIVEFKSYPTVRPLLDEYNKQVIEEHVSSKPAEFLKVKETTEPKKYTKDGLLSKSWVAWKTKQELPPVVSKNYIRWKTVYESLLNVDHFNLASVKQKQWLFYDKMKFPILHYTDNENNPQPAVDGDALKGFGEPGKLLTTFSDVSKEWSYVKGTLEAVDINNIVHPKFKVPGTLTGRLAGSGGLNVQQAPKSKEYLETWVARPGKAWISLDFAALEPHCLAETSRDPGMLALYGPDAKVNDIYLFAGASIDALKAPILETGYDPYNPTPESLSRAKKECKALRQILKVVVLSSQYGAGPFKIRSSLANDGINLSLDEVRAIHQGYWKVFQGIKDYERFLIAQWEKNGGWVLNGIGRPISVHHYYLKDIVNRCTQSMGHDVLTMFIEIFTRRIREAGIEYTPIIIDLHDASTIEIPENRAEYVARIMDKDSMDELNETLGGIVRYKGDANIHFNWAEDKIQE